MPQQVNEDVFQQILQQAKETKTIPEFTNAVFMNVENGATLPRSVPDYGAIQQRIEDNKAGGVATEVNGYDFLSASPTESMNVVDLQVKLVRDEAALQKKRDALALSIRSSFGLDTYKQVVENLQSKALATRSPTDVRAYQAMLADYNSRSSQAQDHWLKVSNEIFAEDELALKTQKIYLDDAQIKDKEERQIKNTVRTNVDLQEALRKRELSRYTPNTGKTSSALSLAQEALKQQVAQVESKWNTLIKQAEEEGKPKTDIAELVGRRQEDIAKVQLSYALTAKKAMKTFRQGGIGFEERKAYINGVLSATTDAAAQGALADELKEIEEEQAFINVKPDANTANLSYKEAKLLSRMYNMSPKDVLHAVAVTTISPTAVNYARFAESPEARRIPLATVLAQDSILAEKIFEAENVGKSPAELELRKKVFSSLMSAKIAADLKAEEAIKSLPATEDVGTQLQQVQAVEYKKGIQQIRANFLGSYLNDLLSDADLDAALPKREDRVYARELLKNIQHFSNKGQKPQEAFQSSVITLNKEYPGISDSHAIDLMDALKPHYIIKARNIPILGELGAAPSDITQFADNWYRVTAAVKKLVGLRDWNANIGPMDAEF